MICSGKTVKIVIKCGKISSFCKLRKWYILDMCNFRLSTLEQKHPPKHKCLNVWIRTFFGSLFSRICLDMIQSKPEKKCQKQPSRGVHRKNCSKNVQQIYRRTPMPKYDFGKVAKSNFIEIILRHGCSPVNLLHTQQTFQRRFDVVFRLIWRRNVAQRQINVETTLCMSTLKFTT